MKTPLFRDGQSSKLAEGPRRVLDRERRPTANFGRVESGIGELANSMKGPRLSDELAAPWQAVARAGQDIERQELLDYAADRGVELDPDRAGRAVAAGQAERLRERIGSTEP